MSIQDNSRSNKLCSNVETEHFPSDASHTHSSLQEAYQTKIAAQDESQRTTSLACSQANGLGQRGARCSK
jgi:hypothetical protein